MNKSRFMTNSIAGAAIALAFAAAATAQNSRSFVATTGSDMNACSATAYCRTLGAALAVTNPGGEVVVVTSGGYGPVTISKPVVITAIGIDASITQAAGGQSGITINTSGNVTLVGLNLHGEGTGGNGILVSAVGFLRLYNMEIENFTTNGIQFGVSGDLALYDSKISDCQVGLALSNISAKAYVRNTAFDNNSVAGALISAGGMATIVDSSAHYNSIGFLAEGGTVMLTNDRMAFNAVGMAVTGTADPQGPGQLYFTDCLLAANTTNSYSVGSGGTMAGTTPGTTLVTPGQTGSGTLAGAAGHL
jgi:hypothetical protein